MTDPARGASTPKFGRSVFVCSKPIQVFNCVSIIRAYGIEDSVLFVHGEGIAEVAEFRDFLETSPYSKHFRGSVWVTTSNDVVAILRATQFDSLFVHDDRVSYYQLFAPLKTRWMILYEEGLGTYRGRHATEMPFLKRLKWKTLSYMTGCGFDFGYGRKTDFVIVQQPETYAELNPKVASKVLPFPGFRNELALEPEMWSKVVEQSIAVADVHPGRICLILGTWGGAPNLRQKDLLDKYVQIFYKPHPHDGSGFVEDAILIEHSWVPAEAFIAFLAPRCHRLDVVHYSSSAAFSLKGQFENVQFFDLRRTPQLAEILKY